MGRLVATAVQTLSMRKAMRLVADDEQMVRAAKRLLDERSQTACPCSRRTAKPTCKCRASATGPAPVSAAEARITCHRPGLRAVAANMADDVDLQRRDLVEHEERLRPRVESSRKARRRQAAPPRPRPTALDESAWSPPPPHRRRNRSSLPLIRRRAGAVMPRAARRSTHPRPKRRRVLYPAGHLVISRPH